MEILMMEIYVEEIKYFIIVTVDGDNRDGLEEEIGKIRLGFLRNLLR